MSDIIQLTISLKSSSPLIRRTVHLNKETSFFDLHHIIQIVMGWRNYHLFEFNLDGYRIGMIEENEYGNLGHALLDATKILLMDILSLEKDHFHYNYDFGDCWLHEITLDQAAEKEEKGVYPKCINGQMNCPPEDCGGIAGFNGMVKILQDKKHPEYKETKNWVGKNYDPESFDLARVNKQLKQLQKYITRWNSRD
ncbi:MAG: plasmid pRiA4b ORF-3 family protein [Ferruginibacter sp.]